MASLIDAARIIVKDCLQVKKDEKVVVIADKPSRKISRTIWEEAKKIGSEAIFLEIIERSNHGEEPPLPVAELMKSCDVFIAPTSKSLSHTKARKEANKAGCRGATLPGITEDIMKRTLTADYEMIKERSLNYSKILDNGSEVTITTKSGTEINMSIKGRKGHPDTGIYTERGSFGNLPAGEAYIAPVEGTSNGVIVVDGAMAGVGILKEPIKLVVENGYVTDISGGHEAEILKKLLDKHGKEARNIAELGIGTNDKATITGNVLEDEKVMGTIHIAIGDNSTFGGNVQVDSHLDGIINKPTVKIDGKVIMKDGQFV
ncbi:aminopeptidase [Halothermothrix orenii]|uniref:Leucyl aminopeptidase (Aminopeptidase T) n=1 Tax=Halothermothrix orenii (strain H 168 / OCM 544 / DSM 9562) TaxID=373903 RepID=B8CX44_HALOH|nr:aminopeptidase [Halothermothrix orenii]ACL69863.1 leucyl aminopeptidase (aminopeptidase T) [Halothermothrix orenii H 168]